MDMRRPAFPTLLLLLLLLTVSTCNANLMAVDLGLGYIKVAIARPGKGLELVTNEQSKRKTPAAIAFTTEGERLFGDAAVAYAAKAPARAVLDGRSLIGQCQPDAPEGPFCERRRLSVDGVADFTGEELVAMLLGMAKSQASAALGGAAIKDVAVTVPPWFDERQRLAVADAARIVGLNCLGVVNSNTAAAIKYALDGKAKPTKEAIAAHKEKDKKKRTPKSITQRVMFYDLGTSGASASIAEITSDTTSGHASRIKMLSHAWEQGVSGRLLDDVIVDRLADAFDKQRGAEATPSRQIPRVMMRLRKEAQKAKEVLSANTERFVSIGSLYDDLDLKTTLYRADFESDARSMFDLVGGPAKMALSRAGLKATDLDAVVPFGGVTRTPRVQTEICDALSVDTLNKSINTDEAAAMGAVFFAATQSSTFRVRKLDFEDIYGRPISAEVEKEAKTGAFSRKGNAGFQKVSLFAEGASKMPSKKTLSLNKKEDFSLRVFLDVDKTGLFRFPERTLYAGIKVKGVADVLKKMKDSSKAKKAVPRVALTFHVDRSGHIRIGTAESSVDETVVVEREVVVDKKEENSSESKESAAAETSSAKESAPSEEPAEASISEGEEKESKGEDSSKKEKTKNKQKKKKKTRIEKSTQTVVLRSALSVEYDEAEGMFGMQMSGKQLDAAKKTLKDLEKADMERVERANALNSLEGYILETRSKVRNVEEDEELYKVSTEEEREKLVSAFDEAEDWMYTDEAKQTDKLRKKRDELEKLYAPMESRALELSKRPEALKMLSGAAEISVERLRALRMVHVERKSGREAEFDKVIEYSSSVKTWATDMESAQASKALTEEPVVLVRTIMEKGVKLRDAVEKALKIEAPAAVEEASAEVEAKGSEDTESANSTAADNGEGQDELEVGPDPQSAKAGAASASGGKDEL